MKSNNEVFIATRQAEVALLGAILIESSGGTRLAIDEVRFIVKPDDFLDSSFHDNLHTRIYMAMLSCQEPPNQITVAQGMSNQGTLRKGDASYMCMLVAECPCSLDYPYYARAVAGYALQRKITFYTAKGDFKKARYLLDEHGKPKFRGGISV